MITDNYGTKRWYNEKGELHRDNDLPAEVLVSFIYVLHT